MESSSATYERKDGLKCDMKVFIVSGFDSERFKEQRFKKFAKVEMLENHSNLKLKISHHESLSS